jgi:hypothetical protein
MNIHPDLFDGDLSSAMGTETSLAHDLVPEDLPASDKGPGEAALLSPPLRNVARRIRITPLTESAKSKVNDHFPLERPREKV